MYMDSDTSVAIGRELYGYPKKLAKISLKFGGQALGSAEPIGALGGESMIGIVNRGGTNLYKMNVALTEKGKTDEPLPGVPAGAANHINLRIIPNVDGKPLIQELTLTHFGPEDSKVYEAWRGPATISFEESPSDPIYKLKPVKILGGVFQRADIWLRAGQVLYKYT